MRKSVFISTVYAILFLSILMSCENRESYTPCRIEIAAQEGGRVQFEGFHGNVQCYNTGNEVVVIAHPDDGYSFKGWYTQKTDASVSAERRYAFTAGEDLLLTARFAYESYPIRISCTTGGSVCFDNETGTSLTLPCGRDITAVAKADDGYTFVGWYKMDSTMPVCPQPNYSFKACEEVDLIARFDKKQFAGGHEYIDLGLPSGTLWATCNVGATLPEECGGYYAWGETEEKNEYTWSTYKWCNGGSNTMVKYCTEGVYGTVDNKTAVEAEDDVAHSKWGGNWRIPTADEQQELLGSCIWRYGLLNGTGGYWVTSKNNGMSIFLPAAGCYQEKEIRYCGLFGFYWSGALCDANSSAYCTRFYDKYTNYEGYGRYTGFTVRPVCR